jgi:aerobic-type carbon monoxide dehydrogenase small subunit (CoxS/CutS family)
MVFTIKVNRNTHSVDVDGDTPLLWVLRDVLGMNRHEVRLRHGALRCLHRAR